MNCKLNFKLLLLLSVIALAACKKKTSDTTPVVSSDIQLLPKQYNKVCFLTTHNSMNNDEKGFSIPNQTHSVLHQLQNGVRGLMLDTYDGANGVALTYHASSALGSSKLVDVMQEIKDYLNENTNAIISIIYQNEGGNAQLEKAIDSIGLDKMTFIYHGGTWPTLQTMVDSNQRLVLFVEQNKLPRAAYLMYAWANIFDTGYTWHTVGEFNCDVNRGGSGNRELYLINHWLSNGLGLPDKALAPQANTRAVISHRVQECTAANNHFLNYLGVDFYEIGDAKAVVDSINGIK
ncbi:MAG: putative integral rane protein [Bacteroidota bacterium]|nr:putative integral rane protein [Bacteroidota bacterium]